MISFVVRRLAVCVVWLGVFGLTALRAQRMDLPPGSDQPVVVESARVSTEITGRIAVTTFDLEFRNPNPRVLEGTFVFPLLDGQRVVRFALDIGGQLREAVPVEKVKARAVFEEIERRQVDPGLLEQAEGNTYRARVYPIPARGTRRVVIAYQEEIARDAAGLGRHRLALDFADPLARFHLQVVVHAGAAEAPVARTTLPLTLPAWENQAVLALDRTEFVARGVVELALPAVARPSVITQRAADGETYFYGEVPVVVAPVERAAPKHLGLLWDASGSGAARDHKAVLALLDAWFAARSDVAVTLVRVRDTAEAPERFSVRAGQWTELRAALERTAYDGASSLDGWTPATLPTVDEWLLVSDGLFNYGAPVAVAELAGVRVLHTIAASAAADADRLRGLAARNHGEFVDLLAVTPVEAARRLRQATPRVVEVETTPGAFAQVFPEVGAAVEGTLLTVTGQLRAEEGRVTVRIGTSGRDARPFSLVVTRGEAASTLAARAWAVSKIAALSAEYARNREDIRRTSVEFGVVTRDTSLLVLEALDDYVRYDIAPPAELRGAWEARRGLVRAAQLKDRDDHLAGVVRNFEERRAWWAKAFPKDKPTRDALRKAAEANGGAGGGDDVVVLSAFSVTEGEARSGARGGREAARGQAAAAASPRPRRPSPDSTVLGSGAAAGVNADANKVDGLELTAGAAPPAAVGAAAERSADGPTITLQAWEPKAGYLDRLKRVEAKRRYAVYLEERVAHVRQPGFFVDVADYFFAQKEDATAVRVLSNLAEIGFDDTPMLRLLGRRLVQAGRAVLARPIFERVLALRPDEPQSYRDLALVCAGLNEPQRAADLLVEVITRPWANRFPDIEQIALGELNALIATCGQALDLSRIDARLRENLPVDLRVVLTWDANDCDIDLWVTDPNGEKTFYKSPRSYQGGRLSLDFTGGYGPEEFLLKKAKPGEYVIAINYYGDRRQSALGPVTAQVRVITGYGRADQREQLMTVRLSDKKDTLEIGRVTIDGK